MAKKTKPPKIKLDLDLALRRVEREFARGRTFFAHPFELELIQRERKKWLADLASKLDRGDWKPTTPIVADAPKTGGGVRPAALLTLADQVVYTGAVGAALPMLKSALEWVLPPKEYSVQFYKTDDVEWLSYPYWCWKGFAKRSLELAKNASVVVVTDITGFYEHIDHRELQSDLVNCGVPKELRDLLHKGLSGWSILENRGLPQNTDASHILASLYLGIVDQGLQNKGRVHVRYRDDTRLFCNTHAEGKKVLADLARSLRGRGLSLQSAKSEFLTAAKAKERFEGSQPKLRKLVKDFVKEIAVQIGLEDEYMTVAEAEAFVEKGQAKLPAEMLKAAYREYFLDEPRKAFDRSLFHFLIKRLGDAEEPIAIEHAVSLLEPRPDETDYVLTYLSKIGAVVTCEDTLLGFFASAESVYPYQEYQFVEWRRQQAHVASERMLSFVRDCAFGSGTLQCLRSASRAFLGRFGNAADLDELGKALAGATSDLEKAEIACCLARMEKSKRNGYLTKVKGDGFLVDVAVRAVKDGLKFFE